MVTLPNNIYFTGAPGSMWSAIAKLLEKTNGFNTTDRSAERMIHSEKVRANANHVGMYFGQVSGFPAVISKSVTDSAFIDPSAGCKILKAHEWAHRLKDFSDTVLDGDWIMLVYRPTDDCITWWNFQGGFDIDYPDYSMYANNTNMRYQIARQNADILSFAGHKNLSWNYFTLDWCKETFGTDVLEAKTPQVLEAIQNDTLVAVYKPGINHVTK